MLPSAQNVTRCVCGWLLACLIFTASEAVPLIAGNGDYLIDVWTKERGLPSSSVTAIMQTRDGYLWAGTYNGLARFDGVRFVTFDPANTPALPSARIRHLFLDGVGTLWINTYDGSLVSYRDGDFELEWKGDNSIDASVTEVSARTGQPVFLLHTGELIRYRGSGSGTNAWDRFRPPGAGSGELAAEDKDGALWCRGRDQLLWRHVGGNFEPVPLNPALQGRSINALQTDASGRVWIGTDRELAVWDGGRFQTMTPTNAESSINVAFLHITKDGDVWVLANDRVRKARGRQWVFEAESCRGVFNNPLDRLGAHKDRNGGMWLYHYGKGIFHIRPDGRTRQLALEEDFPGERVDCFHEDHEGNIWAGVDRGGLVRLREKHFSVLAPGESAASKTAVTVAEDTTGAIWVGTFGGGLYRWQDEKWDNIALPAGPGRGFVFSLFPGDDNQMWASAVEEDLYTCGRGRFQPASPAVHGIKALLVARDGRLWIGTKSGLGCISEGRYRQFMPADGIRRTDVRALAEDSKGVIWAGSGDGILYRIETNHVTSFTAGDHLASQPIWSVLADADGCVWVGTFRGGLMRFSGGQFTRFTREQGLPDDVICQILDDDAGSLWIGSQQGIFRMAKSDLHAYAEHTLKTINCTAYGRYDGLPSVECSGGYQPAAWRSSDGKLLFATMRGVVSVQPEDLAPNRLPPTVVIEEALVDGVRQELQPWDKNAGRGAARSTYVLEVPPGKRQIELQYTALSFVSPDRVRFRTRLDELDHDWKEAGTRRSAQYSFLRPGDYEFHVSACNNDGVWNTQGAVMRVKVLPHFYETWWFLALAGVLAVAGIAGTARHFVVRKMSAELERVERQRAIERDRARIARDIHDDLGAGLTHITLLSELARRSPAVQVPTHLNHISDMARELTRAMDETVWAVNPQNDSLEGLMTYVNKFAQEYLNVAGIRCRLDLPARLPHFPLSAEVRHNVYLAVKEAMNNVVKHAHASEVQMRLSLLPHGFTLVIEDNGRGLGVDSHAREPNVPSRLSSGHGLGNLEKRMAASGGRCTVTSEPGKGTRVEFMVNLGNGA